MHLRKLILTSLLFSVFATSNSQQNNTWYFGEKAGLSFKNPANPSVPLLLNNSAMNANEGCSSISDATGNLLFYSNGLTVYNRRHQVMLNGNGLAGHISAMQGCLIIQQPGSDSLYYIFTTDAMENGFKKGYNYSVVDMSRDNGNGEVISKNVLLFASCTERMTAARHADGVGIWLITNDYNSNIFRAWLITCAGLQPDPVVSITGIVLDNHFLINTGMIKVSPDGTQLCQTHYPIYDEAGPIPNFFQLFDFDNARGKISRPRKILYDDALIVSCEFSADSKLLYVSRPQQRTVDQLECKLVTDAAIIVSRVSMSSGNTGFYGIQLAPDKKIYLSAPSEFLGAINQPAIKGTGCDFREQQIDVTPAKNRLGLPAFINDNATSPGIGFTYSITDTCAGTVQFQGTIPPAAIFSWHWDFGDGTTSAIQNPVHTFNPSGKPYPVILTLFSPLYCDSIKKSGIVLPKGIVSGIDFDMVNRCDSGYVRFINKASSPQDIAGQFTWDFGDGTSSTELNPVHSYAATGNYMAKLKLRTATPCLDDSITKSVDFKTFNIQVIADRLQIDAGETVQLNITGGGTSFSWSPARWLSDARIVNPVAKPGDNITYVVTVTGDNGCKDVDSVSIKVNPIPGIYIPAAFTPNNDGKNDIFRPIVGTGYTLKDFSVFNRWGQRVFFTSETAIGWDGKIEGTVQDSGTYIWIINAFDKDGLPYRRKGTFVLIR